MTVNRRPGSEGTDERTRQDERGTEARDVHGLREPSPAGVKEAQYKQFELKRSWNASWRRARSSFDGPTPTGIAFTEYKRPFHEWAIELIDVPQSRYSGKNSADIRMVVAPSTWPMGKRTSTASRWCRATPTFLPWSPSSGERPLRDRSGRQVVLVRSAGGQLRTSSSFYEDLIRDTKKTTLLRGLPEKKAEAMAQLIDAIQALQRENKETLWGSMVKQTMIRKNPAFNESYYGFSTFSKLLEEAAKQRIVSLERDEKSGTYVITALTEEGGRAA